MSGANTCKCPERSKPIEHRRWIVVDRCCNYSAFSGYHRTPSRYSLIQCLACGVYWRTKAKYVQLLPDEETSHG